MTQITDISIKMPQKREHGVPMAFSGETDRNNRYWEIFVGNLAKIKKKKNYTKESGMRK